MLLTTVVSTLQAAGTSHGHGDFHICGSISRQLISSQQGGFYLFLFSLHGSIQETDEAFSESVKIITFTLPNT